jgi:hypothetical protein
MSNRVVRYILLAAIGLLLTVTAYFLWVPGTATRASMPSEASAAPSDAFTCTPVGVAAFTERVHVRCSLPANGTIFYFAACTLPDSANASRLLSVFTTAKATVKNLVVYFNGSDTSGTACGCSAGDCRLALGAEVQQ